MTIEIFFTWPFKIVALSTNIVISSLKNQVQIISTILQASSLWWWMFLFTITNFCEKLLNSLPLVSVNMHPADAGTSLVHVAKLTDDFIFIYELSHWNHSLLWRISNYICCYGWHHYHLLFSILISFNVQKNKIIQIWVLSCRSENYYKLELGQPKIMYTCNPYISLYCTWYKGNVDFFGNNWFFSTKVFLTLTSLNLYASQYMIIIYSYSAFKLINTEFFFIKYKWCYENISIFLHIIQ